MCRDLRACQLQEGSSFLRNKDSYGNTALHMAVIYEHKEVIDWICGMPLGKEGLQDYNCSGYSPFTLAVKLKKKDLVDHILNIHMSSVIWSYGNVSNDCTILPCLKCLLMTSCPGSMSSVGPYSSGFIV
jgi:hypothetical protein